MGPEVKWATTITANLVNAMEKIIMLVSNPSREGTMECVACELQQQHQVVNCDFRVFDQTF